MAAQSTDTTQAQPATTKPTSTGYRSNRRGQYKCRATQLTPGWDKLIPGEPVSLDLEFQNYKHSSWEKYRHRIGSGAVVNSIGETVLHVYAVYPNEEGVTKLMPPARFMVTHQDLQFCNGAVPAHKVERWIKQIVQDRTVILHGGKHDLTAFTIETDVFARSKVVDMQQEYSYLQWDGTPGLRTAAAEVLGISIQEGQHSPVEDAQTALKLWYPKHSYDRAAEVEKIKAQRAPLLLTTEEEKRRIASRSGVSFGKRGSRSRQVNTATKPTARVPLLEDATEFPALGYNGPGRQK